MVQIESNTNLSFVISEVMLKIRSIHEGLQKLGREEV